MSEPGTAATDYGLPSGGDWPSWQAGRAWARRNEFYGIPAWCANPWLRGYVIGNAIAAPILLILLGVWHG